jgi:hypothetical protein
LPNPISIESPLIVHWFFSLVMPSVRSSDNRQLAIDQLFAVFLIQIQSNLLQFFVSSNFVGFPCISFRWTSLIQDWTKLCHFAIKLVFSSVSTKWPKSKEKVRFFCLE